MNHLSIVGLTALAALAVEVRAQGPVDPALDARPAAQVADYRVHEWGTFTSMVGTDGVVLEGLHREEEALPPFVHNLLRIAEWERQPAKIPASRVTQKMETPVIYFHSDRPLRVKVDVWFDRGLMTQFFPLPATVAPQVADLQGARLDLSRIPGSALHWDVDLVPRTAKPPAEIPAVSVDDPWAIARQVDAAYVRTRSDGTPVAAEAEHYLFYRGLGRWQPRVSLRQDGDGIWLQNGMQDTVPFVAVFELRAGGGRFAVGRPMVGGAEQRLSLQGQRVVADRGLLAGQIGDAVHKALVHSGLHQDEARAMVATWSRSWFQKDGARVIYLLPRSEVDRVLPLRLEPEPKELVRALVGRLEFITLADQSRIEQALRAASDPDVAVRDAAEVQLEGLDRFLEPHLRNIVANGGDAAVRALAERRLANLLR